MIKFIYNFVWINLSNHFLEKQICPKKPILNRWMQIDEECPEQAWHRKGQSHRNTVASFLGPVLNFAWRLHLLWSYGHIQALPHNLCLSSGLHINCNCSHPSSGGKNFKILLLESENEPPCVRNDVMGHDHRRLGKRISGIVFHRSVLSETELFGT